MQITIQQPRNVSEMQPRPTMLSQQIPKQIASSQPILQQTQLAQAQKVIMTQAGASPVIQAAPTTSTISAKLSKNRVYYLVHLFQDVSSGLPQHLQKLGKL